PVAVLGCVNRRGRGDGARDGARPVVGEVGRGGGAAPPPSRSVRARRRSRPLRFGGTRGSSPQSALDPAAVAHVRQYSQRDADDDGNDNPEPPFRVVRWPDIRLGKIRPVDSGDEGPGQEDSANGGQ